MIETKVNRLSVYDTGLVARVAFEVPKSEILDDFRALTDKPLTGYVLTLKKKNKRSLNANAYMWVLCDKIAQKIRATKQEVYIKAVREVGAFIDGVFNNSDVYGVMETWNANGIGWFCETLHSTDNVSSMRLYKGSSVYNGEEMSRLIDYIVDEAENLGIDTMTPDEIEHLKTIWGQ